MVRPYWLEDWIFSICGWWPGDTWMLPGHSSSSPASRAAVSHDGHLGKEQIEARIHHIVFWSGLHRDIEEVICGCHIWQHVLPAQYDIHLLAGCHWALPAPRYGAGWSCWKSASGCCWRLLWGEGSDGPLGVPLKSWQVLWKSVHTLQSGCTQSNLNQCGQIQKVGQESKPNIESSFILQNWNYIRTTFLWLSNHWPGNKRISFERIYEKKTGIILFSFRMFTRPIPYLKTRIEKNSDSLIFRSGFHHFYTYQLQLKGQHFNFSYISHP